MPACRVRIDSPDDERLSAFRNVPDPELLSRLGLFVAEGRLVVARLLASRLETRALLVTDPALASLRDLSETRRFPFIVVPQAVMNGVTGFNFHRGCLALGVRPPARDWREVVEGAGLGAGSANQDPARRAPRARARRQCRQRGSHLPQRRRLWRRRRAAAGRLCRPALSQGDPHVDGCVAGDTVRNGAVAGRTAGSRRARMGDSRDDTAAEAPLLRDRVRGADRPFRRHRPGPRR